MAPKKEYTSQRPNPHSSSAPHGDRSDASRVEAADHRGKKSNSSKPRGSSPEDLRRYRTPSLSATEEMHSPDDEFSGEEEIDWSAEYEVDLSDEEQKLTEDDDSDYDKGPATKKRRLNTRVTPTRNTTPEVESGSSQSMTAPQSPLIVTTRSIPYKRFDTIAAPVRDVADPTENMDIESITSSALDELGQIDREYCDSRGDGNTIMNTTEHSSETSELSAQALNEDFEARSSSTDTAENEESVSSRSQSYDSDGKTDSARTIPCSGPPHLIDGHTVIVGAGIVGLFTARELAIQAKERGVNHKFTVLDVHPHFCALASGNSAGMLTARGMPKKCNKVSEFARNAWDELWENCVNNSLHGADFDDVLLIDKKSARKAHRQANSDDLEAPSWWTGNYSHASADTESFAGINSRKLAFWAFWTCQTLGIDFRFNHRPYTVSNDENSDISSIIIENITNGHRQEFPCTNLVLACGPFTTFVCDHLFPSHNLVLENNLQYAVRLTAMVKAIDKSEIPYLYIPNGAARNPSLGPAIYLTARPEDDTITVSAVRERSVNRRLLTTHAVQIPNGKVSDLLTIFKQHLDIHDSSAHNNRKRARHQLVSTPLHRAHLIESRTDFISTGPENRPVITKIPREFLFNEPLKPSSLRRNGIWLCYGFGFHGTFLAPGAAKMMAEMFFRDAEDKSRLYNGEYGFATPVEGEV
ncbi:Hypothetical protein R9X50_00534900 [Acrodontium crateriforme]|uniref:FAD-dependent oxidoreductase domain-containing protein 1 n=1 Tax=Acrodontium crateriforme TaxID=150365 RepID=A0AAQ3M6Z4_9PEZI|nr:Hypothetical protein R9X50_00534900 [Acrodontium crateriforme]